MMTLVCSPLKKWIVRNELFALLSKTSGTLKSVKVSVKIVARYKELIYMYKREQGAKENIWTYNR
jgi:hypothetical protein